MNHRAMIYMALFAMNVCSLHAQDTGTVTSTLFAKQASTADRTKSPDGLKTVSISQIHSTGEEDFPADVEVTLRNKKLKAKIRFGLNTEMLWSPDSNAFAITGSSEGANGLYWTTIYLIQGDKLVEIPVTEMVRNEFGNPVKCSWPEYPNVAAIEWLKPSVRILVAAEIINHSNCDSFGTFKAYEVDIANKSIVATYDQLEVKKRFGTQLGPELAESPDSCVRAPQTCFVPANHPQLMHK